MNKLLLGVSPEYLYFKDEKPSRVSDFHKPYFYVFSSTENDIESARKRFIEKWQQKKDEGDSVFSKISDVGDVESFRSFWDFGLKREVFKVFFKRSYFVPEISDFLFFDLGLYTAEHDIPYNQRVICDLEADNKGWVFDTDGSKKKVNVLVYDIETTQYGEGKTNVPIDIIGWANFDLSFVSSKDLKSEDFSFDITDIPDSWKDIKVNQLVSHNLDEEINNLFKFCKILMDSDIISGHNILGFDNLQIYNRINWFLKNKRNVLSEEQVERFEYFLRFYCRSDRSFHFGTSSDVLQFYPCCLDTYLGARKFYSFLNDFSLKGIAPFLGIEVKDRLILKPSEMRLDERTIKYNRHDVQEQLGVTLNLIQQAMPLSFTTGMPFDLLFGAGAVQMWDHMSMIRASFQKKLMPPICRVMSSSKFFLRNFNDCKNRREIASKARKNKDILSKETIRLVKYGEEMPYWVENPEVIYNSKAKDSDERLAYHMPGGMTIKPDKDADSHFIPWWNVIVADVGAMYPTILKAMNIGADTVRIVRSDEKPDYWIWLKKIPMSFLKSNDILYREASEETGFADEGYRIGVKIDEQPGVVNCAMTGIMSMIAKVKKELNEAKEKGVSGDELNRLKMMYQSVKGARNAGSVDYKQRIVLINPKGDYCPLKIGDFVDQQIKKNGSKTDVINGTKFEIAEVTEPWYAISVTEKGKTQIKRINKAVRHKYNGKLVKITTKSGSTVVTPNHSVFTVKNNRLSMIDASDLTKETLLVHAENQYEKSSIDFKKNENKKNFKDCFAIPAKNIELVDPSSEYVYDISVEDNENFVDVNGGIILHNTHGIISAPNVSGRQFNLWGAATITTRGQQILADSLDYLEKKDIRVVYGDSVDADTDVIIRERGLIKIVNIKDLFENLEEETQIKQKHEYKNLEEIECLSVDKNGFFDWKRAVFIKRHRFDHDIVNVKTQRGNISVTKNHSLYTLSKGLKTIYCKDIVKKKSKIVHLSHVENKGKDTIINALDPLLSFDGELNIWVNIPLSKKTKHLLKHHQPRNNYKGGKSKKKFIRMKIQTAIELYKKDVIRDTDLKESKISSYNGKGKIPVLYKMDEDFARLIGAYTAEGSLYFRRRDGITREGAHIFVCGHENEYLKKIKNAAENIFKKEFRITHSGNDKNGDNFRIQGNSATAYIFKYVLDCGKKSNRKKISPFVLSAKKNIQKAFFEEYVNGDGYYDKRKRVNPLLEITSRSKNVIEGISLLSIMLGYGIPSVDYRKDKKAYRIRIVQYNRDSKDYNDVSGIEVKKIKKHKPTDGYVYDISVDKNNNFVSANGLMLAHNTDGIYLGCSRSMGNVSGFAEKLGVSDVDEKEEDWLSKPDLVLDAISKCNSKWRDILNYPDFELEPEFHDCMIFVKHKNYLIFDQKDDKIEMNTKGNNFKGSDKADIARKALKKIMFEVLKDNPRWTDEKEARKIIRSSIVDKTKETIKTLDLEKVDIEDLTLIQSVQPAGRYKPNQDGSMSTFGKRSAALEKLLGRPIKSRVKFRFVVTKKALPGISNPSKSGVKPIDYMYPVELLKDKSEIDLDWYKQMVENYIKGAFGLSDMSLSAQTGLDAWM